MNKRPENYRGKPHTDGLPKTEPLSPSQLGQDAAAKRMLRRLVQGENPPTAPMSIVDRLAGSPYANPMIQVGGVDTSARKTLDFALHLAETMFRYGAGALEVETSIIAVTAALGLKNIEVDITNQSVAINYAPKDQPPIALLRVVRSWTNNYAGLAKVHRLVTDIVAGGVGRDEAIRRLDEAITSPKPFPRWMVTMAFGVFAAVFVGVLGGGPGVLGHRLCGQPRRQPARPAAGPVAGAGLLYDGGLLLRGHAHRAAVVALRPHQCAGHRGGGRHPPAPAHRAPGLLGPGRHQRIPRDGSGPVPVHAADFRRDCGRHRGGLRGGRR